MELQSRKLLSDDDLEKYCESHCYFSCSSICLSKCSKLCSDIPVSIPPPTFPTTTVDLPLKSPHKLSTLLICTIALVSFTFFLVLCCAVYLRFYPRRTRRPSPEETQRQFLDEEHGPVLDHPIWYIRTIGLPPPVISAITVCKYKRGDGLIDGTECSVCLSEFQEDETLRLLPKCSHAFHLPCIDTWLQSHTNCPMCRAPTVIETARTPLVESDAQNFGQPVGTQLGNLQNSGESRREQEDDGGFGSRAVMGDEIELPFPDYDGGGRTDDSDEGVGDIQPMRRSVSLDFLSVLQLKADLQTELVRGNGINAQNDSKKVQENQSLMCLTTCSSSEKSQESGRSSIKRSVSCGGKFLLRSTTQRNNAINYS